MLAEVLTKKKGYVGSIGQDVRQNITKQQQSDFAYQAAIPTKHHEFGQLPLMGSYIRRQVYLVASVGADLLAARH